MSELRYRVTVDDTDFKKKMAEMAKIVSDNSGKSTALVKKGVNEEVNARQLAINGIKKGVEVSKQSAISIEKINRITKGSFVELSNSAKDVHTNIAKIKSGTLDLTQAERGLRKALKDNLITEDEYIKKLAIISARRTELNDKLRDYRSQLKAVEVEKAKAKPYTAADTEAELKQAGNTGQNKTGTVVNTAETERATQANKAYAISSQQVTNSQKGQATSSQQIKVANDSQIVSIQALKLELADYQKKAALATDPTRLKLYNNEIASLQGEIGRMSNVGKTGFDSMGNAIEKNAKKTNTFTTAISKSWSVLRMAAYIIPGLGIAGLMSLMIEPIMKVINNLGILKKTMGGVFTGSEYKDALKNVKQLEINVNMANKGIIDKDKAVKNYNKNIGETAGKLKNFSDVEKWVESNSLNYIKAIKMRSEAQALFALSIDQITEAQKRAFEGPTNIQKGLAALGSIFQSGGMDQYRTNLNQILNGELSGLATTSERAEGAWARMLKKSEEFNKENGFNFDDKETVKRPKSEKDTLLQQLEESLSRQATAFEKFEQFKTSVNETEAKKRFANELGEFKTFSDYVQSEFDDLFSEAGTDDWKKFNESQKNRYDAILKATQTFNNKQRDNNNQAYIEAFEASKSHLDKLEDIEEDYYRKVTALGEGATIEQLKVLDEQREAALRSAKDEAFLKTEIYKKSGEEALVLTRAQLKEQIKAIEELLSDSSITGGIKNRLEGELSSLKINLNIGAKSFNLGNLESEKNNIKKAIDEYLKINNIGAFDSLTQSAIDSNPELKELINKLKEVARVITQLKKTADDGGKGLKGFLTRLTDNEGLVKFAEWGNMAANAFSDMSNALGGVDTQAGYALDTVSQLVGTAANLGSAIASGNPVQIVGAVAKGIASVFSIGKKVKEMNAEARQSISEFYTQAIEGEREYQDLINQRALDSVQNSKGRLQGIREEIALRKDQANSDRKEFDETMSKVQGQSYIKDQDYTHGTWFRKAKVTNVMGSLRGKGFEELSSLLSQGKLEGKTKALVERLVELEQKGYNATKALADLAKETAEIFTGTTADNLTDSLANMFREGKTGVQDLADFFQDTMQDAAMSIFKNKVLADMMNNFYDEFAKAAESGDELTMSEIEMLRNMWITDTTAANKKWDQYQEVTGLPNVNNSGPGGITNRVADLKEVSAKDLQNIFLCQD